MDRIADPHSSSMMDRNPGGSRCHIEKGIQNRPVGNGTASPPHPFCFAIRGSHRTAIEMISSNHNGRLQFPSGHHIIKNLSNTGPLTVTQPADPCRKPLKFYLLPCQPHPPCQREVIRKLF